MSTTDKRTELRVKYLHPVWQEHELAYATSTSAGLDLRACIDQDSVEVGPGERIKIPTGIAIEIDRPGLAGFLFSRSGLGAKHGLTIAQGVGVIDPDYRGEIIAFLLNTSNQILTVRRGQRVAQLVLLPYYHAAIVGVDELGETVRGAGGFGHTGDI